MDRAQLVKLSSAISLLRLRHREKLAEDAAVAPAAAAPGGSWGDLASSAWQQLGAAYNGNAADRGKLVGTALKTVGQGAWNKAKQIGGAIGDFGENAAIQGLGIEDTPFNRMLARRGTQAAVAATGLAAAGQLRPVRKAQYVVQEARANNPFVHAVMPYRG